MVLDNADDIGVFFLNKGHDDVAHIPIASYLPKSARGKILVTSRSLDAAEKLVGSSRAILQTPVMREEQALELLRKRLEDKADEAAAVDLVRALDCIPLAVNQAAAYINRRSPRATTRSYLDEFRKSEKRKDSLLRSDKGDLGRHDGVSNSVVVRGVWCGRAGMRLDRAEDGRGRLHDSRVCSEEGVFALHVRDSRGPYLLQPDSQVPPGDPEQDE
jgi:hypothetical protein